MKKTLSALVLTTLLLAGAQAEEPKLQRTVENGVPRLTIHSKAPPARAKKPQPAKEEAAPQKEFKVYDLGNSGQAAPPPSEKPTIVVVSSPPPIAPGAYSYGYGYGWGAFPFGVGLFNGFGVGFQPTGPLFPVIPGPAAPVNYQNPPVNYQPPVVNYQNRVPGGRYPATLRTPYR